VLGAFEDPNRMVEYRNLAYADDGTLGSDSTVAVAPYEKVMDRIPPAAELQVGVTYLGIENVRLRAVAYNAFHAQHYNIDAFHSLDPRLEILPNPFTGFRAFVTASYHY